MIGHRDDEEEGEKPSPGNSINSLLRNDLSGNRGNKKPKPALVTLIGPGEVFGDYEALNEKSTHQFSLICNSVEGELLVIDKWEFIKKVTSST